MTLKALFRVRLLGLKSMLTGASRSTKKRSKAQLIGFALLMLYTFGYFGFMMYGLFSLLAGPFSEKGLGAIYFALAAMMCFSLMLVGSVFTAKAQLYEATDNDLLLSMPIPPRDILLSRMLLLFVLDQIFGLIVSLPALIAWFQAVELTAARLLPCLGVFYLLLPLLALMLSALLGWLLHLVSARVRNQSLMTVLLSLVLVGAYMYAVSQFNIWFQGLAEDPSPLEDALNGVAPLIWLGRACAGADLAALGGLALAVGAILILGWILLERSFVRTATDKRGAAKLKYVERTAAELSPDRALLRRELKHFAASPGYILNGAFGVIMAPIAAVFLAIKREALLPLLDNPGIDALLPLMILLGLCFLCFTCFITAPSISLEGKSLWLLQSLPVTPQAVLRAKLRLHLLVCLAPLLPSAAVLVLLLRPEPLMTVCFFLLPAVAALCSGLLGLFENLRHPNLDWINETQAIKTGLSVLFTMLIGCGVLILPVLALVFLPEASLIALGTLALLAVLSLLLWRWLMTRGAQRFRSL